MTDRQRHRQAHREESDNLGALLAEVDALIGDEVAPMRPGSAQMLPVMEPRHNYREIAKQFLLLEDHLFHPKKECPDCIRKHLLTSEALAEEAVTLDSQGQYSAIHQWLPDRIRSFQADVLSGEMTSPELAQSVRQVRKRLAKLTFDMVGDHPSLGSRTDGSRSAPVETQGLRKKKRRATTDISRLGEMAPAPAAANPYIQGLGGGEPTVYAYRGGAGKGVEGWYYGNVALVGEGVCGPQDDKITSIPQQGWIAIDPSGGGSCLWAYASEVMPLPTDEYNRPKKFSAVFAPFKKITLYAATKTGSVQLNPQRLAMIDVIYAVMSRTLAGAIPPRAIEDVVKAAVINAAYESALDPGAEGDGGLSVGLFQLHEQGAGRGMTKAQRANPLDNATRISKEFLARLDQTTDGRNCPPVKQKLVVLAGRARAAQSVEQLPTVAEWTAAFASQVECPASPTAPQRRARTAAELFGGGLLVAPRPVRAPQAQPVTFPPVALSPAPQEGGLDTKTMAFALGSALLAGVGLSWALNQKRSE